MTGDLECCPKLENGDVKYVSGLSTILVATIQEAKDRISQIEYIFCNQLYPNFQAKSKSLQKIYADAEGAWKEKEKDLLEQIEKLRVEKQEVAEGNKVEKEKPNEKANALLAATLRNRESRIDELEQEVVMKSKEIDEGMELQNKLLQLVQTKAAMIVDKGRELKRNEGKSNELLAKVKSLEKNVEELQDEVRKKSEKVAEKTELANNLSKRVLSLLSSFEDNEKLKTENEQLMHKVECLEKNLSGLKNKLREKTEETEGGRVLQAELKRNEGKSNELLAKVKSLEKNVEELQDEVRKKSEKVAEKTELANNLSKRVLSLLSSFEDNEKLKTENEQLMHKVECLEKNLSGLKNKLREKTEETEGGRVLQAELKRNEGKSNELLAKVKSLEKNVEELQDEVRKKSEKVAEKTELANNLSKRVLSLLSSFEDNEKLKTENEQLMHKVECLEKNLSGLKNKLREKTEETEGGRVLQAELLQQIDMNAVEILKQKEQLDMSENDKKELLEKVNGLEEKVNELQENLSSSGKEAEGKVSYDKLLHNIQLKDSELLAEKRKMRDLHGHYMKLRSQYNYLCTKSGLTMKNMLKDKLEDESGSFKHQPTTSSDGGNKSVDASAASCETKEVKTENEFSDGLVNNKVVKSIPIANFKSPTSIFVAPKCPPTVKSAQIIGTKRPASSWIDTRSHQGKDGPDPHDDFLDTPLEKLRADLDKTMEEEVQDLHIVLQNDKNMDPSSSGDETQDINLDRNLREQQMPVTIGGKRGFKYVEPVRKKAERQNLKGVECKQCKKFYDAVLPNNGGDGNKQNVRCEHHDGVSRHRYKYVPPMTPEGFWNIGFESEM